VSKQAIIFDVDGTLVDTNAAHVVAWEHAFRLFGYEVSQEAIHGQIGKGGDKLVPALLGEAVEQRDGEALRKAHGEAFIAIARKVRFRIFSGVHALFAELRRRGLRVAAATSSKQDHLDATLRSSGLELKELVDEVVTKSEAGESKPAPDLVEAAVEKLGLSPDACVMVGDTPYDVEAASRAGVRCVGLLCGGIFGHEALFDAGAAAVFRDPEDLCRRLDEVVAEREGAHAP
jgi:HAD superfamily hydrolase (TIGR01509 family)